MFMKLACNHLKWSFPAEYHVINILRYLFKMIILWKTYTPVPNIIQFMEYSMSIHNFYSMEIKLLLKHNGHHVQCSNSQSHSLRLNFWRRQDTFLQNTFSIVSTTIEMLNLSRRVSV